MKISVVINNYNYQEYVEEAILSALNQSVPPHEIVVIDDKSTDRSPEIIQSLAKKHPQIRYFQNEKNLGITGAINRGVELATGDYVALLASDDIYLPEFLESSLKAIEQFPNVGIVCSNFCYFLDKNSNEIFNHPRAFHFSQMTFLKAFPLIKAMRTHRFWIPSPAVMRKDIFLKFGGYTDMFGEYTDFIIYSLIGFDSGVCYIPQNLAAVRNHSHQMSKNISLNKRRQCWSAILHEFTQGRYTPFKSLLKRSHLLYLFGVPFFYYLLRHPKYWSLADFSLWKKLTILWRRQKIDPKFKKTTPDLTYESDKAT